MCSLMGGEGEGSRYVQKHVSRIAAAKRRARSDAAMPLQHAHSLPSALPTTANTVGKRQRPAQGDPRWPSRLLNCLLPTAAFTAHRR